MVKVSSAEFQKNIGRYQDVALTQPVLVMRNGRDRTVLLSVSEYERLKKYDTRRVMRIEDFTQAEVEAIRNAPVHPDAHLYDDEVE